MRILFDHATVLTMESDRILEDAMVAVEEDKLTYIGPRQEEWLHGSWDRQIDATDRLLMPGFINTHAHVAMSLMRSYGSGLPLMSWLETKIWPVENRYTHEDFVASGRISVAEMLLSGTTCFLDMNEGMDELGHILAETGMRGVLARGTVAFDMEMLRPKLAEGLQVYRDWNGRENGRIRVFLSPHAEYTNCETSLLTFLEKARELDTGLHIHVAETAGEVQGCYERHGMSPVQYLDKLGLFERPCVAAHCVYVSEEDIRILADRGVAVAHNPSSNMKLASGAAPVAKMLEAGVCVALGTDGAASNDRQDILREANLASLLAKFSTGDATRVGAYEALTMATVNGARALGLSDRIGTLTAGKQADMILLDISGPNYQPGGEELLDHIVFSGSSRDIVMTMVDGRILMEDRQLTTLDLAAAQADFTRCARRLYQRDENVGDDR